MIKVFLGCLIFGGTAQAVQFDPPDLNLEFQLHQKFLASQGNPAVVAPTNGVTENYRLQKGETLWTLSEMLYGDGHYWPRVWAQNPNVTNPHLVRQGHMLQFLLGSEDQTPAFRFSEDGGDDGVELTAGPGQNPIVEIPPPEVPPKPVLKIPGSFPEWQSVFAQPPDEFTDYRQLGTTPGEFAGRMYLHAYVQEEPLASVGNLLEVDSEAAMPVENQYVYVKLEKGFGAPGKKLLSVSDLGPIKRINPQWDEKIVAHIIQVNGELQLSEAVPAKFSKTRDQANMETWRALVTRSTGLSIKDSALIEGKLQVIDTTGKGTSGTANAQVIGSAAAATSALYGPGDLVFLNKGTSHGIATGQLFSVFSDRTARHADTPVQFSTARSGLIKVVHATDRLSTAIVINARETLMQGDLVREASARGSEVEKSVPIDMTSPSAADGAQKKDFRPEGTDQTDDELEKEIDDENF
jgi:hypothetical protein